MPVSVATRQDFFSDLALDNRFDILYNSIPGLYFFVKNTKTEFMLANKTCVEAFGHKSEEEVLGKTDFDIFPRKLAEVYYADDMHVLTTGMTIEHTPELVPSTDGEVIWLRTCKIPLRNKTGEIVGLTGICQTFTGSQKNMQSYLDIKKVVDHIEDDFATALNVDFLAEMVNMSVRQLERKFKKNFHSSLKQHQMKTRVLISCDRLLKTNNSIANIALEVGFYDQSDFSRHFKQFIGKTPARYRRDNINFAARRSTTNRQEFFSELALDNRFDVLYNNIPGLYLFVKNRQSQFMLVNQNCVDSYGVESEKEVLGKTDSDFFPPNLADVYYAGDKKIFEEGEPIQNAPELVPDRYGHVTWLMSSKIPLRNKAGEIVGVAGICQSFAESQKNTQSYLDIKAAVDYVEVNFAENLNVEALAEMVNMSVRQLERKFKENFHSSLRQYQMKSRILVSCDRLLRTNETIANIATEVGFYDQSSFNRHFKRHIGITPAKYRREKL